MMKLKSFSFLVTGGAGFIGTNLVQRLLGEGGRVFVLDNLSSGFASNIPSGANFIEGDVADPNVWKTLPSVDYIYHLGAMVSVVESIEDPIRCEQVNVHSILHLLDYARRCKVRKIMLLALQRFMAIHLKFKLKVNILIQESLRFIQVER